MSMANPKTTPRLEKAIKLFSEIFNNYSGNQDTLSKAEFKQMLTTELGDSRSAQEKEAVDKVMGDLDSNHDKEVNFKKFMVLVSDIAVARNNSFVEHNKKAEKKK